MTQPRDQWMFSLVISACTVTWSVYDQLRDYLMISHVISAFSGRCSVHDQAREDCMIGHVILCTQELVVKNSPVNEGDIRDLGSIPGLGRSPGGGHGNQLQYSCLENAMDRGAWQDPVHWVSESWIQLKRLSTPHACTQEILPYEWLNSYTLTLFKKYSFIFIYLFVCTWT